MFSSKPYVSYVLEDKFLFEDIFVGANDSEPFW